MGIAVGYMQQSSRVHQGAYRAIDGSPRKLQPRIRRGQICLGATDTLSCAILVQLTLVLGTCQPQCHPPR